MFKRYRNQLIGTALIALALLGLGVSVDGASEAQARGCRGGAGLFRGNGPVKGLVHRWQDRRAERRDGGGIHLFQGRRGGGGCSSCADASDQAEPELAPLPAEARPTIRVASDDSND